MKRAVVNSFGIIPIHQSADGRKVLLVEQYSAQGTHWGFPKGQAEEGETPKDTAERELREEVGLYISKIISGESYGENYSFTYEDTIVDKTVEYFIGYVRNPGFALKEDEISNAGWFNFTDARNKITHPSTRDIFDKAVEYLEENEDETYE